MIETSPVSQINIIQLANVGHECVQAAFNCVLIY